MESWQRQHLSASWPESLPVRVGDAVANLPLVVAVAVAAQFQSFSTARLTEVLAALPLVFRSAFKTAIGFDPQPLIDEAVAALSDLFPGDCC